MIIATLITGLIILAVKYFQIQFLPPSYFSNIVVSAQGEDVGYWAGWYGPEFNVRDSEFLIFSVWD